MTGRSLAADKAPCFLQQLHQLFVIDRLGETVQLVFLKFLRCKLVKRGDKNDDRQAILVQRTQDVKTVHAGHLDIQQDQVRRQLGNHLQRFAAVAG